MSLTALTLEDFLKMFDPTVHEKIKETASKPGVDHIVCCEVLDMWSPHVGERTAIIVGPGCTYKLADFQKEGAKIGDVPSRFKYPVAYAAAPKKEVRRANPQPQKKTSKRPPKRS